MPLAYAINNKQTSALLAPPVILKYYLLGPHCRAGVCCHSLHRWTLFASATPPRLRCGCREASRCRCQLLVYHNINIVYL